MTKDEGIDVSAADILGEMVTGDKIKLQPYRCITLARLNPQQIITARHKSLAKKKKEGKTMHGVSHSLSRHSVQIRMWNTNPLE